MLYSRFQNVTFHFIGVLVQEYKFEECVEASRIAALIKEIKFAAPFYFSFGFLSSTSHLMLLYLKPINGS